MKRIGSMLVGLTAVFVVGCSGQQNRAQLPPPTTAPESAIASPTDPPADFATEPLSPPLPS